MIKNFLLLLFVGLSTASLGQVLPVSSTTTLTYPYPNFLFDYYETASNSMQVTLQLNDLTVSSRDVRIKITIDNGTVELSTRDDFKPLTPITLLPGVPKTLSGSDLFDALNVNNLNLKGITPAYLNQNAGRLPEGQYTFCVTVLEYQTGKVVSQQSCAGAFLQMRQPPVIVSPQCESSVVPSSPQIVRFNWQEVNGSSPSLSGFNTYKLFLYKVMDKDLEDPQNAVANAKAVKIFESESQTLNTLNIDFSNVILEAGTKYVYRIKATGPNGKETYANDGYSNWCWFSYGYETGGTIELKSPFNGKQFSKTDQKIFNWGVSDAGQRGQPYTYKMTIVELSDTAPNLVASFMKGSTFLEETLRETSSQDGANFLLSEELESDKSYAWKIEASSAGKKVAESRPKQFHSHTLIDNFYASNQIIKVRKITNKDLNNLAGVARVFLSDDPSDFYDVDFEEIRIREVSGTMIMTAGNILLDLSDREPMDISSVIETNGDAIFKYSTGQISSRGLSVNGSIEWKIPHAVLPGEESVVKTYESRFMMDSDGKLTGEIGIKKFSTILMSPKDFVMDLSETSILQLVKNKLSFNFLGSITLPENVKSKNSNPIKVEFNNAQKSLDYIEINTLIGAVSSGLVPFDDFGMELIPLQGGIIDLSESKSPGKLSADAAWKGFYITRFKIRLEPTNFDASNQLSLPARTDINVNTEGSLHKLWVGQKGLSFKSEFELNDVEGLTFNSFPSDIKAVFDLKNNNIKQAVISGAIKIPFLDDKDKFTFKILATVDGLEEGYLDEDLTERELVFNPFGGENRMEIAITRAVFEDNERINLTVDINIPELGADITGISDFRIYGDNYIGIGGKNSSKELDDFVQGKFKDLRLNVIEVGAAFFGGTYALSYRMQPEMPEGITGENGPASFAISSVVKTDAGTTDNYRAPAPAIAVSSDAEGKSTIEPKEFKIKIASPILEGTATLSYLENDPEWGTKFEGGLNAKVKLPFEVNLGTNLVLGITPENMDYWYLDAYYEDATGFGVPVKEPVTFNTIFNLVGMEGKIFHHMKAEMGDDGSMEIELDPSIIFGMGIYAQIIDPEQKGFLFQADLGAELEIQGQGLEVENVIMRLSGEASFLNLNGLRARGSGRVTNQAVKEVAQEVAQAAISGFLPQEFTIASTKVKVSARSLEEGSVEIGDYTAGDGFLFGGSVASTPGVTLGFAKDGFAIGGSADASGAGSFTFAKSDIALSAAIEKMDRGTFAMDIGDLKTEFGGDIAKKKADLAFTMDDLKLGLDVDGMAKEANINIEVSDFKLEAGAKSADKSANIGFEKGGTKLSLAFNGNDNAGSLSGEVSGLELKTAFDAANKKGDFFLSTSNTEIEARGSKEEGIFIAKSSSETFSINSNFVKKTGKASLTFPNNILRGEIGEDFAEVFMKRNNLEVGANSKFDGSAGGLHLKEGSYMLDLEASATKSAGSLAFKAGSALFTSAYDPNASSFIKYINGTSLREARVAADYFKAHYIEGSKEFMLEANAESKVGAFVYKVPDFEFTGSFNPGEKFAKTIIKTSGIDIVSYFKNDSAVINYMNGQQTFDIAGVTGGSGTVRFNDDAEGISTGFGFDKANSAGSLYYRNGDTKVDLAGNKSAGTGSIYLQKAADYIDAGVTDSMYINASKDEVQFWAVHMDGKSGARYKDADKTIAAYKLTDGEILSISDGTKSFSLAREAKEYKGRYTEGDFSLSSVTNPNLFGFEMDKGSVTVAGEVDSDKNIEFNIADDSKSLSLKTSGGITDVYDLVLNSGNYTAQIKEETTAKKSTLSIAKGDDKITLSLNENKDFAKLEYGVLTIEGGIDNSKNYLNTTLAGASIKIKDEVEFSYAGVSFTMPDISKASTDALELNMGNDVYKISPDSECGIAITRNNSTISYTDNQFSQAYGSKSLKIENSTSGQNIALKFDDMSLDIIYSCSQLPKLKVVKGSDTYIYEVKDNKITLDVGDYAVSYEPIDGKVRIENGSSHFELEKDKVDLDIEGYEIVASANEFTLKKGDFETAISKNSVEIKLDDKIVKVKADECDIQLANNYNIKASPTSFALTAGATSITATDAEFKVVNTDESVEAKVVDGKVSLSKGSYTLDVDSEITIEDAGDKVTVSARSLEAKVGTTEFRISDDKEVSYKKGDKVFAASETSLDLTYDGTSLKVLTDKVTITTESYGSISASETLLKYVNGTTIIALDKPFETPAFSYNDGDNSLLLSSTGVALDIEGKKLEASKTKVHVSADGNKFTLTENDLDFKYEKYEARFNDWKDVYLTNGVQEFKVNKEELYAKLDDKNLVNASFVDNVAALQFIKEGEEYTINTSKAEFDYSGQHFVMTPEVYLRVHKTGAETNDGLYLDNDGLKYVIGEVTLKLGTPDNYAEVEYDGKVLGYSNDEALFFSYDTYLTTVNKQMVATFTDGTHIVTLNDGDRMAGYSHKTIDFKLGLMKFETGIYGLKADVGSNSMFIKGAQGEDITAGGNISGLGAFAFTTNNQKDIEINLETDVNNIVEARFRRGKEIQKLLIKVNGQDLVKYDTEVDAFGEGVSEIENVEMDGPAHLSNLTSKAGGWAVAAIRAQATLGRNFSLVANGRVQTGLNIPLLCADASFGFQIDKDAFLFKLAEQSSPASLKLLCTGGLDDLFRGEGYARLRYGYGSSNTRVDVALGLGWSQRFEARASVTIPLLVTECTLGLSVEVESSFAFGGSATIIIPTDPENGTADFKLNSAYVNLSAMAAVGFNACGFEGSISASVSGNLNMENRSNGTYVSGEASGSLSVGPISQSFTIRPSFYL